ncbi:hypothetical protein [Nostoc sp. CHAB 5715]|uniref:hypothetical protein n=1 Tax=Nostoc sp. CHAB 5715 TaxID=2780400 RepID=UPI001E46D4F7|nr:hypothetical protein [Nostoc sp. CHAB 5715]MCC5625601.1 hypothetical protein [Nostoc sp. CHAB 5715]
MSSAVSSDRTSTGAPKGTKKPVRYHLEGAWVRISSAYSTSSGVGPTKSSCMARIKCDRTSADVVIMRAGNRE